MEKKDTGIRTKFFGKRTVVDVDTGERFDIEYAEKKVSHSLKRGWRRVYLENFMEILTGIYSQGKKIDVVEFLLENLNSENQFTQTQDYVVKKLNISKQTVNDAFKYLVEQNFMKKIGSVYVVNPDYVCAFGSDKKNATIAVKYSYDEEKSLFDTPDSPPGAAAPLRAS